MLPVDDTVQQLSRSSPDLGWPGLGWAGLGWAGLDCVEFVLNLIGFD